MSTTYTDADRVREVARIRSTWVSERVDTLIRQHDDGGCDLCTADSITAWENESYRIWRETYPALNSLLFPHTAEATS